MATESGWRARKIQAGLSKLGIRHGLTTISRYLPKVGPRKAPQQRWMAFLWNHRDLIAGMDFFVVPTVRFELLYVWFALDHGRRRVLHYNVTAHPTANWVIQQLRDAFSDPTVSTRPSAMPPKAALSRIAPRTEPRSSVRPAWEAFTTDTPGPRRLDDRPCPA